MQRPAGKEDQMLEDGQRMRTGAGSWLIVVVSKLPTVVTLKVLPAGDRR